MTILHVMFEPTVTCFSLDDDTHFEAPCGPSSLTDDELHADPPRAEELTNAIGAVLDHLDDLLRELPGSIGAEVTFAGTVPRAIAAVELGTTAMLPMSLSRDAVEDVFRTLATESAVARSRNPGLDTALVPTVVGGCCIAVAIIRRLHLEQVTVTA